MVTRYDIFEFMYTKGGVMHPKEVVSAFNRSDKGYKFIYRLLTELVKLRMLVKSEYGFEVTRNKKNDQLFRIIKYCIANNINYNELLDENITGFISKGLLKSRFSLGDFGIHPRTYSKYVHILSKNGLLVTLSQKPLTCYIPYNSFLRDLISYFGHKVLVAQNKEDEYFAEITREIQRFRRLKDANVREYQKITGDFETRFIHHSLSLEGNPITLPDTIKLLRDHITPAGLSTESVEEVQNYQKAMQQMIQDAQSKRPLTVNSIMGYHYLAMQHRSRIAGKIRDVPVHIRNNPHFKVAGIEEIEPRLSELLKKYNLFRKGSHSLRKLLEFAAYFHNEFQYIHPFEDGSSRTTRLITFHLLRTQDVPIFDIPLGLMEKYLNATKGAEERDDGKLEQVLQQIILYNLKTINAKLS